uniref:Formin homology 2 domain containing 3 n=1 Tax=Nothobranchius furzeri TaxID=105023 RepID=A0A8C6KFM3_NOTFU
WEGGVRKGERLSQTSAKVQFLDDTDPFNSTNFPEPTRPPLFTFREDLPLINQIAGVHRLLKAPHKPDDCALQLSHSGSYLDLESTLAEQRDELEGFQEDRGRGKKHSIILRTQLSVRVHACIEKLYNSTGRELRRALFSLKQIFQDDKDLVHEFVVAEGLTCLIKVGAEADQNYQNYILRALGQIMLYVDGMNGLISHSETVQWLYSLVGSKFRLVVKTSLKLLLVFVEYTESNAALLIQAVNAVETKRGTKLWWNIVEILEEKDGVDSELLVFAMTLINKTLAGLPDQDSYYDMVDCLEDQGLEAIALRHLGRKGTDLDLVEQFNIYEMTLRHEDGDDETQPPPSGRKDRRRASLGGTSERRGLERRRSRRHSLQNSRDHTSAPASPKSPHAQSSRFLSAGGQRVEDISERCDRREQNRGKRTERSSGTSLGPQARTRSPTPEVSTSAPPSPPDEPRTEKEPPAERDGTNERAAAPPEEDSGPETAETQEQLKAPERGPNEGADVDEAEDVDVELEEQSEMVQQTGRDVEDSVLKMMPPPPPFMVPVPPPSPQLSREETPLFQKKKKTIRLFWSEVRLVDWQCKSHKFCKETLWSKLEPINLDTSKLELLFETKSKELSKAAVDGKRSEIIVLDSKRSNAINIGLTVLPPPRTIKTAILNFDEYALNKEGIEKILTMIPTEEEKQKIQEAQLMNPDVPLGSAEQFLLTLSSITELSARLQLWAFRMDYELVEKEVAEPLQDLKEGMDQLEKNKTLKCILTTLLAIGNFLNGSNAKGFQLTYLEKVPEVKDTVHKQSLLHHACSIVVEKFPESTDLYSEIGAITRLAKVDFDQLQDSLAQMERRCKASWDHLKVIAKHEMKPALKQKMSDFLKDCAERIIILKIVHRRILNRFHAFLLFLGHPIYAVREVSIHRFSKILSEFALEYRTTRERVLQQKQKRANHRERNKTRGKMITDVRELQLPHMLLSTNPPTAALSVIWLKHGHGGLQHDISTLPLHSHV